MCGEGYSSCCVCVSVCLSVTKYLTSQAIHKQLPPYSASGIGKNVRKIKIASFRSYGVKHKRKGKLEQAYLERVRLLCVSTLKAQEVTTKGLHLLPHAIYCCSAARVRLSTCSVS